MINKAETEEELEQIYNYRSTYLNNLLSECSDLVYYGRMSISDIDDMVHLDRKQYIHLTSTRLEESVESLGALGLLL